MWSERWVSSRKEIRVIVLAALSEHPVNGCFVLLYWFIGVLVFEWWTLEQPTVELQDNGDFSGVFRQGQGANGVINQGGR